MFIIFIVIFSKLAEVYKAATLCAPPDVRAASPKRWAPGEVNRVIGWLAGLFR